MERKKEITYSKSIFVDDQGIPKLEGVTGFKLPTQIKQFFKAHSGARPSFGEDNCLFDIIHSDGWKHTTYLLKVESFQGVLVTKQELEDVSAENIKHLLTHFEKK